MMLTFPAVGDLAVSAEGSKGDGGAPARSAFGMVMLFVVGFVAAAGLLQVLIPANPDFVYHPTFTAKQRYLAETDEHYTVAVIGNSRVVIGFDPEIFDTAFADAGCAGKSYNLGSVNQSWYEYQRMIEALRDTPGGTPEVIVSVDTSLFDVGLGRGFDVRHRVHMELGSARKAAQYRAALPPGEHPDNRLGVASLYAGIAANQVPVGLISQHMWRQRPVDVANATQERDFVSNRQGFEGWTAFREEAGPEGRANLRATIEQGITSGQWEARWAERNPDQVVIDQWISTIEAHIDEVPDGTLAVHTLMPSFFDRGTANAVEQQWNQRTRDGHLLNLLDDPRLSDYRDPDYWLDWWHVNEIGTVEVSRAMAQSVCSIINDERPG